jgi:hypothetical protein
MGKSINVMVPPDVNVFVNNRLVERASYMGWGDSVSEPFHELPTIQRLSESFRDMSGQAFKIYISTLYTIRTAKKWKRNLIIGLTINLFGAIFGLMSVTTVGFIFGALNLATFLCIYTRWWMIQNRGVEV